MQCWSSPVRGCVPTARTHKTRARPPPLSQKTHISSGPWGQHFCSCCALLHTHRSWSCSLGERAWLAHLVFQASDLHMTLELRILSSKPVKLSLSFEGERDRQTLIDWFRLTGRGCFIGWKILFNNNNNKNPFLLFKNLPTVKIYLFMVQAAQAQSHGGVLV